MKKTKQFQAIESIPYIGVHDYLVPDTQRDAIMLNKTGQATIQESSNHCKNTSCTVAWNSLGKILSDKYPVMRSMITMGEYQYNNILEGGQYILPGEKIQDWLPHIRCYNDLFQKNRIPLRANFSRFMRDRNRIYKSLENGYPVVLGTMITKFGHIVLLYRINLNVKKAKSLTEEYIIIDPYGNPLTNYKVTNADYYKIPFEKFYEWVTPVCNCIWFDGI